MCIDATEGSIPMLLRSEIGGIEEIVFGVLF